MVLASIFAWLKYRSCCGSSSRMSSGIPVGFQNHPLPFSPKKTYSFPFNGFPWLTETKLYAEDNKQWTCFHVSWVRSMTLSLCLLIRPVLSWRNPISFLHHVIKDKIVFSGRRFKNPINYLCIFCATQKWNTMVTHPNMFRSPLVSLCLLAVASSSCGEGCVCVNALNMLWGDRSFGRTQWKTQTQRWGNREALGPSVRTEARKNCLYTSLELHVLLQYSSPTSDRNKFNGNSANYYWHTNQHLLSSIISINTLAITPSNRPTSLWISRSHPFKLSASPSKAMGLTQWQKPWCSLLPPHGWYSSQMSRDSCQNCGPSHGQW